MPNAIPAVEKQNPSTGSGSAPHPTQTIGPVVDVQSFGTQGAHRLYVRAPVAQAIGGPASSLVELEASVCGFGLRSALTPAAARVLAINLIAGAERVEALQREQHAEALKLILAHLAAVCGHSERLFHWVTGWLAYPLQNPGAKLNTCLQICGGEGTGKSLTAELFAGLYAGAEARVVDSHVPFMSVFNAWLVGRRFVVIEGDISPSVRPKFIDLLASKQLHIETQGKPSQVIDNQVNLVLVSNELPEPHERRRILLNCHRPQPGALAALAHAMQSGGQEAFKQWLLQLDIADFADHQGLIHKAEAQPCAA